MSWCLSRQSCSSSQFVSCCNSFIWILKTKDYYDRHNNMIIDGLDKPTTYQKMFLNLLLNMTPLQNIVLINQHDNDLIILINVPDKTITYNLV